MADKSLAGHFLVASRYLRDPNFVQSVVLMIHHDREGAMGVVINRPSDKTVREVWEMIGNDPCERDDPIFVGGPVPGPLVALHSLEAFSDHEVLPGLYVSTHRDALDLIVRKNDIRLRLCSGNAGWGSGQLEGELGAGGWLFTRATVDDVFADHESIWKTVTQRIGLEIMAPEVDSEHVPPDPSLN
ncbi:MAG TPA: YqgE/AlgH family protein [Lacipirellulaceae bacterium]|nr:YqgE/AlgH family protein [Lacipirellulaceae bacterium]